MYVITYPCCDYSWTMLVKGAQMFDWIDALIFGMLIIVRWILCNTTLQLNLSQTIEIDF